MQDVTTEVGILHLMGYSQLQMDFLIFYFNLICPGIFFYSKPIENIFCICLMEKEFVEKMS